MTLIILIFLSFIVSFWSKIFLDTFDIGLFILEIDIVEISFPESVGFDIFTEEFIDKKLLFDNHLTDVVDEIVSLELSRWREILRVFGVGIVNSLANNSQSISILRS